MRISKKTVNNLELFSRFDRVNKPEVSVLLSVFNGEKFIRQSILSILNQTFRNFELILINDGSTDNTLSICKELLKIDKRIILINKTNSGLTESLIIGTSFARSEYIARQDADDRSIKNRLEIQLQFIKKFNADLICTRAYRSGKIVPHNFFLKFFSFESLILGNIFIHGTFFFKKSILKKFSYKRTYTYAQDFRLIVDLIKSNSKVLYLRDALYYLGENEASLSILQSKKQVYFANKVIASIRKKSEFLYLIHMIVGQSRIRLYFKILYCFLSKIIKGNSNEVIFIK